MYERRACEMRGACLRLARVRALFPCVKDFMLGFIQNAPSCCERLTAPLLLPFC